MTSFPVSLQYRRDSSFYLCGEVSWFLSMLCSRIYTPDTAPLANAWFLLLLFQTSEGTFLPGDEYLIRLKMTNKVSIASKVKAEGLHFGKKSERSAILATALRFDPGSMIRMNPCVGISTSNCLTISVQCMVPILTSPVLLPL